MKQCILLLLAFACIHGVPIGVLPSSSCKDPVTNDIAEQAIKKINLDRNKGYILSLERVVNVFQKKLMDETGVVYYLTAAVLETSCHVLSKKNWKDCPKRSIGEHPVYGQCKVAIFVNKPKQIVHLYKYSCNVRPVAASKIVKVCPDCPTMIPLNNAEVEKTMKMGLEKFNSESMLANYFAPLEITRATMQGGIATFVNVEFTIQETTCSNQTDVAEVSKCNIMACEFAHKGFCKASHASSLPDGSEHLTVKCEIYEPEAAEEEKQHHLSGKELDHHHENIGDASNKHDHSHDHTASHSHPPTHDHDHDSSFVQEHKDKRPHDHTQDSGHHHTHEHDEGHSIAHGHAHSHEHSHDHDHSHAHHDQAHNHTRDQGFYLSHHNYGHTEGETHEHDHELALDHEHKHGHLHTHEHHHHHHQHSHEENSMRKTEGTVRVHSALDQPSILPFFPDPFDKPDAQIPGDNEPIIGHFPTTISPDCPAEFKTDMQLIKESFAEDPLFKIRSDA